MHRFQPDLGVISNRRMVKAFLAGNYTKYFWLRDDHVRRDNARSEEDDELRDSCSFHSKCSLSCDGCDRTGLDQYWIGPPGGPEVLGFCAECAREVAPWVFEA